MRVIRRDQVCTDRHIGISAPRACSAVRLADDKATARVLAVEHRLYPRAAAHLCRALQAGEEPTPMDAWNEAFRAAAGPEL